jgi:hypothetical protein
MNRIIKSLAHSHHYFLIFLVLLVGYAALGCWAVNVALTYDPSAIKLVGFLVLGGAAVLATCLRMAHNLSYTALQQQENDLE